MKIKFALSLLFSIFFCLSKQLTAQNLLITYEVTLTEDHFPFEANLFIQGSTSLFLWKSYPDSFWERQRSEGIDVISQWVYTDSEGFQILRKIGRPDVRVREFCKKDFPVFYEDTIMLNWQIIEEKKAIEGYPVTKAKTTFRGREYHAWFSEEIPLDAGPWKFNGLPGLIFEVFSTDGSVSINLKNLENLESESIPTFSIKGESMTRKEFISCLEDEYKAFYKKNQAIIASLQAEFPDVEITDAGLSPVRIKTELDEN